MRWRARTFDCAGLKWSELQSRLADLLDLRAKSKDRYVVLISNDVHRFVQFAHDDPSGSVRCEAVSNNFLTGSGRLSRATVAALVELGWNEPTAEVPNFWRTYKRNTKQLTPAKFAVRTMRHVFRQSITGSLSIECGVFATATEMSRGAFLRGAVPELELGEEVGNLTTGQTYRVGTLLGKGGFGAAYRITQIGGSPELPGELCLKIATDPEGWHTEAYFGQLLKGVPRAIEVHASFAIMVDAAGGGPLPLYCLVTELASRGDVMTYMAGRPDSWSEARACREVAALLRVLMRLHLSGAVHRDLTPGNVLVTGGEHLKLGDFGAARHRLGREAIRADVFNPAYAPPAIAAGDTASWQAADDVYQMGVILAVLLGMPAEDRPGSADVKCLTCSAAVKAIIQRAIGERRKRFRDAGEMLAALEHGDATKRRPVRMPASLAGKRVVFTGALAALSRREAAVLVENCGGQVELKVTSKTDIVVQGSLSAMWKADEKGDKLLDVDREAERGHYISVIDEGRFMALAG